MSWYERISFLKKALGSGTEVGAVTMSSKHVVEDVLRIMPKSFSTVVEYGSGDGVMTRALLEKLPHDGKMLAIESNEGFVVELQKMGDVRLKVMHNLVQDIGAEDMGSYSPADVVVSSIPFSFLSLDERLRVVSEAHSLLAPGGLFIVFHQYSWLMQKPIQSIFGSVSTQFEARNMPPCFILWAQKQS